jgi:putative DNA primase/helicase
MERVASALEEIAAEVRLFDWGEAPEKGDAADHPAITSGDRETLEDLKVKLLGAPGWEPPSPAADTPDEFDDVGTLLSDVVEESVEWMWEGRIPLGKLTVIDGDPGTGKSALTTDLAARVSTDRGMPTPKEASE